LLNVVNILKHRGLVFIVSVLISNTMKAIQLYYKLKEAYDKDQGRSLEKMDMKIKSFTDSKWYKDIEEVKVEMPHVAIKNGKEVEFPGEVGIYQPRFEK